MKTKLKKSYYHEPTAVWLRIVGDALNYIGAAGGVLGVVEGDKALAITFIIAGAIGKAITNAFTTSATQRLPTNDEQPNN